MRDPTREAAFDLLSAVLDRRRPLEEALDAQSGIEPRDRAAGHRLAAAVLRRMGSLDAVLEPFLAKAPPPKVMHILRLGAAALLLLETPPHAAVATAVELTRTRGLAAFAKMVNAVLRRVAEAGPAALEGLDGPRLDTPGWLWSAWGKDARAIATAHLREAPLDLSLMPGHEAPDGSMELPTGSWRYPPGTADLCAAPGGKTAQLAAAGARVTAIERDPKRLARLRENLARLKLSAETVEADATQWRPEIPLDAILLDAPCSATGTIRRHPDVPHLKRPRDILALATQQDAFIAAAAAMLRPGGRLIYAVCSLQLDEGPIRMRTAARTGLRPAPFTIEDVPGITEALTPEGYLRTTPALWPALGGMDGFFVARFIRD